MLRLVIILPFLAVLVAFVFFNQDPVSMQFIGFNWKCSIGIFSLLVGLISFLLGACVLCISTFGQWRRARRAEQKNRNLEDQLNELRAQYISLTQQPMTQNNSFGTSTPLNPSEVTSETSTVVK